MPRVRAQRLPGVSKTPLWLLILAIQVFLLGGIIALYLIVNSIPNYVFLIMLGVMALIVSLVVHCVVSRRLTSLTLMMQQDPQVIVGDPACLLKLQKFSWYGVAEVDGIQMAVAETYNSYAIDARRAGKSGGVSHAGGDDDLANLEWQSAVSFDGENDTLSEYLLDQRTPRTGRSVSAIKRIFTPRGSRPTTPKPIVRSGGGGGGGGSDSPVCQSIPSQYGGTSESYGDDSQFQSALSTARGDGEHSHTNESSGLLNTTAHHVGDNSNNNHGTRSVSMATVGGGGSSGKFWDPLNDNESDWDVLQLGLKDPGSSLLVQLLSQVKVGSSLSAVTLPVHILESRSLLEKMSDMFVSWHLLMPLARKEVKDPYDKLENVFRWFISAYRMKPDGAKKPFNPILGESFRCDFGNPHNNETTDEDKKTPSLHYLAEQVSHHPPVTAIYASCPNVCEVQGIYFPKSKLVSLNCAASLGEGGLILNITPTGERYQITFPSAYVSGITISTPRLELGGTVTITDLSLKSKMKIEFLRKGFFTGTYDQMKATMLSPEGTGVGREFYGTWFETIYKKGVDGKPASVFHDPKNCKAMRPEAMELKSHPKQSRAIWKDLTQKLRAEDAAGAGPAKHAVETIQRTERKEMAAAKKEHQTTFFKFKGYKNIKEAKSEDLQDVGNWRFVGHDVLDSKE